MTLAISVFITMVLTTLGLLSLFLYWRFVAAFPDASTTVRLALGAALVFLALGRFISVAVEKTGAYQLAEVLKVTTEIWLVMQFWFLVAAGVLLLWNLAVKGIAMAAPGSSQLLVPPRASFLTAVSLIALASIWGWFEASAIKVETVTVTVKDLPQGMDKLRVAQISDLHIGAFRSSQRLARAVELVQELKPDMIVSTGDLLDTRYESIAHHARVLALLNAPLGKFAVKGNHEFYSGGEGSVRFHEEAGFVLLRGTSAEPLPGLKVVGVDDPAGARFGQTGHLEEHKVLTASPRSALVLFLKHQPTIERGSLSLFDLQLSGHTHGGQVFPFGFVTRMVYRYGPGLHELDGGARLYVSRGTGTWGPPLRLMSPPEVTLIEFVKGD